MSRLLVVLILVFALSGCRTSNSYGECKGLANKGEKRADLVYEVSTRNVVLAAIFSETLLWPILTGAFWLWCPTGEVSK